MGLGIVLLLAACARTTPPHAGDSAVLGPNTYVFDDDELNVLTAVSDTGTYSFSATPDQLAGRQAGDIVVLGVSAHTPDGAVRRIDAVVPDGAGVKLETSPAGLEEAFEQLHVSTKFKAQPAPAMATKIAETMAATPATGITPQKVGISFPVDISVGSGANRVRLQGAVGVVPDVELTLSIDVAEFELDELSLSFGASESFEANLTGSGTVAVDESTQLGVIPFTPFVIVVPTPSGPVPVPVTPVMVIEAGLQGSLTGQFEASVLQQADFTATVGYVNGAWGATSDSHSQFDNEQPTFAAGLNLKAKAGARLEARILGLVGPYAKADAYVALNAAAQSDPPCVRGALDAGISATAGVDLLLTEYDTTLFDKNFPLASFDSCDTDPNAPRPAVSWARSYGRDGSLGENARAVAQASDGTYLVVGDSTRFDGVTGAYASIWGMRLDALGNVLWQRAYGGLAIGPVTGAIALDDGFLISTSLGLVRLDLGGNVAWVRSLEGPVAVSSVTAAPAGSAVLAGRYGFGVDQEAWASKVDAKGNLVWSRRYGADVFNQASATSDGGFILTGEAPSNALDVLVVKLDAGGGVQWRTTIDDLYDSTKGTVPDPTLLQATDAGMGVVELPNHDFLVVGQTYGAFPIPKEGQAGHYALFTAHLHPDGAMAGAPRVHRIINGASYTVAYGVALRNGTTPVIVGRYAVDATDLFQNERILLQQGTAYAVLGGTGNSSVMGGLLGAYAGGRPIVATADGGVIVAGTSNSFGANEEAWVVKFGRTTFIDFPYLGNVPGDSYDNEHAVATAGSTSSTAAPIDLSTVTAEVEVTPYYYQVQAP